MSARRRLLLILGAVALVLLAGRALAAMILDYRWYAALGAGTVWWARAQAILITVLVTGGLGSLFAFANLYAVRGSVVSLVLPRRLANLEIGEEVPSRYLLAGALLLSILLGIALTQTDWTPLARVLYTERFNESDPYFDRDLAFFVGWLPLERAMYLWALLAVLLVGAVVVFLYALTPSLKWERGSLRVSQYVRRHLSILGALLLLLLAWSYRIDGFELLGRGSGAAEAFSYADHRVLIPANAGLFVLTIAGALVLAWTGWQGQLRAAFATISVLLLVSLVLHQIAPAIARRSASERDPVARERPYLATRAAYTRRAFALEQLAPVDSMLAATSMRLPAWDVAAAARATSAAPSQGQVTLPNGALAMLAVSGTGSGDEPGLRAAFVSLEHADERGLPLLLRADGAAVDEWSELVPTVVVDSGDGHAVVADSAGTVAGVPVGGGTARLVPALALQNFRLLTQDLPHPDARLVLHRNVRDIVAAVAPLFDQGSVVTPALAGDTLYWLVDLYATSEDYPLSARVRLGEATHAYLRHAGTGVVNAVTARVTLVVDTLVAPLDPLGRGWRRAFGSLYRDVSSLDASLASQLPPLVDAAVAQRAAWTQVSAATPGRTPRTLPATDGADSAVVRSGPTRVSLGQGALAATLPILTEDDRVDGLIVATAGTRRVSRWLPARTTLRWTAGIERLRGSDSLVAAGTRDVKLLHGPVRAAQLDTTLALQQSVYFVRAPAAPTLAAVSTLRGDSVSFARPGTAGVPALPPVGGRAADLRTQAGALYDSLRAAQRRGDWRAYADHWEALGRLLGRSPR